MEFKGTKGKLELKYVSGICIGIGTVGNFSQMTANSIIDHIKTDKQYKKEKIEIESNMLLYSKAPEMLEMLDEFVTMFEGVLNENTPSQTLHTKAKKLIKEATEL